jgi:FtsH-binding integral membrane protein
MIALIFYLIGFIIAICIYFHLFKKDSYLKKDIYEITLTTLFVIILAGIFSWVSIFLYAINWLYENGEHIVIYRFKK